MFKIQKQTSTFLACKSYYIPISVTLSKIASPFLTLSSIVLTKAMALKMSYNDRKV